MDWLNSVKDWFLGLGQHYNVNPVIFGEIYVGAIPFFFASLYWTVRNMRKKRSFFIPLILTGVFFISAYLYLIIAGRNIPVWVYVFIGLLVGYSAYSTWVSIKNKARKGST